MKRIFTLLILLVSAQFTQASKTHIISVEPTNIDIPNRTFFIDSVFDIRSYKENIGVVYKGLFNTKVNTDLLGGVEWTLRDFYNRSIPAAQGQTPIIIEVAEIEISEEIKTIEEVGRLSLVMRFYHQNTLLYTSDQFQEKFSKTDVTYLHAETLQSAFKKAVIDFSKSGWETQVDGVEATSATIRRNPESVTTPSSPTSTSDYNYGVKNSTTNRDVTAIGYQIGGYALIGINHEIRVSDIFGIHFGIGYRGYTAGIKLHTKPHKDSGFFNLSYKDGGFGIVSAIGAEFGNRHPFYTPGGFGFHWQAGFAKYLGVDPLFVEALYGPGGEIPPISLSLGIGLSW